MNLSDTLPATRKEAKAQGSKHYFTGKPCKRGHIAKRFTVSRVCADCMPAHQAKYNASDKGRASAKRANEVEKNRRAAGDADFIARRSASCARWREKNRDQYNTYMRVRRIDSPAMAVRNRLQTRLHHFLNATNVGKSLSFDQYVGCSPEQARQHIQSQFVDGMNWDNMGQWHIDHIRPCASFDLTDPEQQKQCFHYTNLQPLWAADNLAKSDKWEAA